MFRTTVDQIGGYRATQQVLSLAPLPTAIFTVNNMTAVGAMQALRERGMSVPQDMGLVCFDDVEHLAVLSPFLTVIDQPAETFGSLGDAASSRAHLRQGRRAEAAASCCRPISSCACPAVRRQACRIAEGRPASSIGDRCFRTAGGPATSLPETPIPYDAATSLRCLNAIHQANRNLQMTRIKPSLPAEGIFLGRARVAGMRAPAGGDGARRRRRRHHVEGRADRARRLRDGRCGRLCQRRQGQGDRRARRDRRQQLRGGRDAVEALSAFARRPAGGEGVGRHLRGQPARARHRGAGARLGRKGRRASAPTSPG